MLHNYNNLKAFDFNRFVTLVIMMTLISLFTSGCSTFKKDKSNDETQEARPKKKIINPNVQERTRQAADEGGIMGVFKRNDNNFQFATSNILWRSSLSTLDFVPLATVDYAGGVIITDWYGDGNSNEEIKITVQFLSSEVNATSIKVKTYKRTCEQNKCKNSNGSEQLNKALKNNILANARKINIEELEKKNK